MGKSTPRLPPDLRRAQIVDVTLDMIRKHGVQGASMTRIADGVGVTTAALYAHFENREALLLAALDSIFEKLFAMRVGRSSENAIEHLREIGVAHREAMSSSADSAYAQPLFEFIAAASEGQLRDALVEKQLESTQQIARILEDGKREGTISENVDAEQVAWMFESLSWGVDAGYVMGIEPLRRGVIGQELVEILLRSIAAQPLCSIENKSVPQLVAPDRRAQQSLSGTSKPDAPQNSGQGETRPSMSAAAKRRRYGRRHGGRRSSTWSGRPL